MLNTDPDGVHTDPDINTVPPQLMILSHDDTTEVRILTSWCHLSSPVIFFIGKTFLMGSQEDGQQNLPKIVKLIKDHVEQLEIILPSSNWNAL